jgi:hypothetical protein
VHRKESHRNSTHRDIGVFVVEGLSYDEIMISDSPRRSGPLIQWRRVAQDLGVSGFDTSELSVSKEPRRIREASSATGPTVIACGINRWHHISGFGTWEVL